MKLYYKKICLTKKNDLKKIAIFESEKKKINYLNFIKLINIYVENLKKLGSHVILGCMLDNSIEVAALMFAASKLKFSLILLEKNLNNEQLKKYYDETNFDYLILNKKNSIAYKEFKKKTIFIEKILEIKIKKKIRNLYQKFFIGSFSSGTTSNPKPIFYSEKCKFLRTKQATSLFNIKKVDKIISYSPIHHSLAQRLTLLALTNYSTLFIIKKFNLFNYINLINEKKINILFPISSHLKIIFEKIKNKNFNFIKLIVGSSADLSIKTKKNLFKYFKNKFMEIYGLSEAACLSSLNYNDFKKKKYNSVGKACKGVTLKIFKYKKNKQNIGEIGCKTKLLSSMSLDKNKYFKAGFYLTGDLGYIKKNYLYLSGRKKEIIIKSGINIFPSDIQVEVNKNKFINSSFVLGVKDDFFGEVPICICELKEHTLTKDKLEKIKDDINSRLPKTHIPHKYIFLKKIKLLKTGKVDKLYYKKKYQTIRMPNLSNLFIN